MPQWTVYTRHGCSLCEQLIEELALLLDPIEAERVRVIDIDSDPELIRRYASRIPVLTADDEFVCAYRLDKDRVVAHLGPAGNRSSDLRARPL
jgi:hypothetical protein